MSGKPKSILKNPTEKKAPTVAFSHEVSAKQGKSEQNFVPTQPLEKVGPNPLWRGLTGSLGNPREKGVSPFTRAQQFELGLRRAKEDLDEKLFEKMNPYHSDEKIKRLEKERDARELEQQQEDEANTLSRRDNKLDPDQAGYYSDSQDDEDLTPERIARNAARKSALETFYKSTFAPPSQNADFSSQRQPSANQRQPSANQQLPLASQRQPPSVAFEKSEQNFVPFFQKGDYAPDARPPPLKNWRDELPENLYFRPDSEELAAKDLLAAQRQLTAFLEADPRDDEDEDDKLAKLQADIDFVTKRQTILRELRKGGRKTKKRERRKATGKKTKKRNKKLVSRKTARNKTRG